MKTIKDYSQTVQIDEKIIANLQELNDPDEEVPFFESLVELYSKEAPMASVKLAKAIDQCDREAVIHFSHKLKGLSRNLGLRRLSEICATIEHGANSLSQDEQMDLCVKSRAELDQVIVALSDYIKPKAA